MYCPYCSVEYNLEQVCFCLPSTSKVQVDQQPQPQVGECCDGPKMFLVDPLWYAALTDQPYALSGLA